MQSPASADRPAVNRLAEAAVGRGAALAVAALVPFMIAFVAPLTFYFGNREELHFGVGELLPGASLLFAVATLGLYPLVLLAGRRQSVDRLVTGVLVGLAAAAWLQAQVFVWDFGPLDGLGIDWSRWSGHMRLEWVVWALVPAAAIGLGAGRARALGQVVAVAGALSIAVAFWSGPAHDRDALLGDHGSLFRFHPLDNTIVIVLDTFHSRAFQVIMEESPDELGFLDGFTYYPDTIGGYPTTYPSLPYLLTGRMYENREPIQEFLASTYAEAGLPLAFERAGYGVSLSSIAPKALYFSVEDGSLSPLRSVVGDLHGASVSPLWTYLDGGLFRVAPTALKDRVYGDGRWLLAYRWGRGEYPPDNHGNDLRFLEIFERHAAVASDREGELRLYHLFLPHPPVRVGANLEYDPEAEDTWRGYLGQARGALALVRRMLATLDRLGVYHGAEIVVTSDHGVSRFPRWEVLEETAGDPGSRVPERVHMAALPLLLHKPSGARGAIAVSDRPMELGDIPCLLPVSATKERCAGPEAPGSGRQRSRRFLFYDWEDRDWHRAYLPPMTEYVVTGHAWDPDSWSGGDWVFAPGEARHLQPFGGYRLGQVLDLSRGSEDAMRHLVDGWSAPEGSGTWTSGPRAHLYLRLSEPPAGPIELRLFAVPYRGQGELPPQPVAVHVNGEKVADWNVAEAEWYRAVVSERLARDGVLEVRLELPAAVAPARVGDVARDHRLLGLHVHRVVLEKAEARVALTSS